MEPIVNDFISVNEAARISHFHRNVIAELYHEGVLSGYSRRKGCKIIIAKKSLLDYMDSCANVKAEESMKYI